MDKTTVSQNNGRFPTELFTAVLMVILVWGLWAGQAFLYPCVSSGTFGIPGGPGC